jgi:hypothetical protein
VILHAVLKGTPQQPIRYDILLIGNEIVAYRQYGQVGNFPNFANPPANPPRTELGRVRIHDPGAQEVIRNAIENDIHELVEAALRD